VNIDVNLTINYSCYFECNYYIYFGCNIALFGEIGEKISKNDTKCIGADPNRQEREIGGKCIHGPAQTDKIKHKRCLKLVGPLEIRMAMERVWTDIVKLDLNPNPSTSSCPTHKSIHGHG
jgi:hypothetical protein